RFLAERAGRGAFRPASAACGIGRVGGRTKGCAERAFFSPDSLGLHEVRASQNHLNVASSRSLRSGLGFFCLGFDEQTDARHLALRAVAARCLASAAASNGLSDWSN